MERFTAEAGAVGFVMPRPTPTQLASLRAGQPTPILWQRGFSNGGVAGRGRSVVRKGPEPGRETV